MEIIYSFTVSLFLTIALIPLLIRAAPALGLMDLPGDRKVHVSAIPRSGGLAIALGVVAPLLFLLPLQDPWRCLLIGGAVIVVFGVLDDRRNLDYRWKFLGQIIAVILAMTGGVLVQKLPFMGLEAAPLWVSYPLTFFFLLGVTNAVNLSDGLDGLAAGTTLLALAVVVVLGLLTDQWQPVLVSLTIIGGVLGFLRYNTHPAQVFMGDTGSQFLGFMTAALALMVTQDKYAAVSPVLPVLILGVPILDTLMVMSIRIAKGRSPFSPDRNHIHHQLIDRGLYHYEAVAVIYLLQLIVIGLGFLFRFEADIVLLFIFITFAATLTGPLAIMRFKGWRMREAIPQDGRERRNQFLRKFDGFYANSAVVVKILLGGFMLAASLLLRGVPGDILFVIWALSPVLVTALILARRWPVWVARLCCYSASILLAYLLARDESVATLLPWIHGYLLGLALVLALAIRMTRREHFRLDTQDMLVLLLVLTVPLLPLATLDRYAVGEVALRLAVMMYSCEFLIGRTGGRGLLPLSCAAAVSVLLLAVLH